jgi:hypothetical protein
MFEFLDDIPSWAYNWCYFFAFLGALQLLKLPLALLVLNRIGFVLFFAVVLDVLINSATIFTLFWMCRSSLRNSR